MSTSDPKQLVLDGQNDPRSEVILPSSGLAHEGLLDPAVLARMANEMFSSLPSSLELPQSAFLENPFTELPQPQPTPASAPAMPPEQSLPSDKHLPMLPGSVGPATFAPVSAQYQAGFPAIPGAVASTTEVLPEVPIFSFLSEARPIFSDEFAYTDRPYKKAAPITDIISLVPPTFQVDQSPYPKDFEKTPTRKAALTPPSPSNNLPREVGPEPVALTHAFSFIRELRPLFSDPMPPVHEALFPNLDSELINEAASALQLPNEFLPPRDVTSLAEEGSYGFMEWSRTLEPIGHSNTASHIGFEEDVPQELSLSSYLFDAEALKRDFPILRERVNGRPLVWLDNAATTQKPQSVIDRLTYFYEHENSNVHRGAHELAARATDAYEAARDKVRRFLNASSSREIVFVRGATEGINLIAKSWGKRNIQKDDEIVITWLEHHANIVPWQMLCSETGAKLRISPVDDTGQVLLDEYEKLLGPRTRLVSITQVSNALGVVTPARQMIEIAHRYGAKILLDGAQSVSHMRVDVELLDCDFFVFSGHKVFGPTGIGVVYGKPEVLESMPAWQGGGNMIQDVTFEKTTYHGPPQRFEAGTGNIADAVGLGAAIDYLDRVGMPNVSTHEHELLVHATQELIRIPGLQIIGTAREKAGVLSFVLEGFRTEEVGGFLNKNGIAVRSGHHCAQPILRRFGLESTIRASLALYNTHEDIERLVTAVWNLRLGRTTLA